MKNQAGVLESLYAEIVKLHHMIDVLIKGEKLHEVGAYAHAETVEGEPFIILYEPEPALQQEICRVYEADFDKLPPFVDTSVATRGEKRRSEQEPAVGRKLFQPCPLFSIATRKSRKKVAGEKVRFSRTVAAPPVAAEPRKNGSQSKQGPSN